MSRERINELVADCLERIDVHLGDVIDVLRGSTDRALDYALLYELRRELSTLASDLGDGEPQEEATEQAKEILGYYDWECGG